MQAIHNASESKKDPLTKTISYSEGAYLRITDDSALESYLKSLTTLELWAFLETAGVIKRESL